MVLTQERVDIISKYIMADEDRAKKLIQMSAKEAAAEMKKDGLEVTEDELNEFMELAKKQLEQGELSDESLENVAGGGVGLCIAAGCLIAFGSGVVCGGLEKWGIW